MLFNNSEVTILVLSGQITRKKIRVRKQTNWSQSCSGVTTVRVAGSRKIENNNASGGIKEEDVVTKDKSLNMIKFHKTGERACFPNIELIL